MVSYSKMKIFTLHPSRGAEYCDQPVCLCVCVCLRAYLWNLSTDLHEILCGDPL